MTGLRPVGPADLDAVVALNEAAVPAVSTATPARMRELVDMSTLAWVVADDDDAPVGFALLFEPGSAYDSPNYRWFADRYDRFLYLDRIVVAEARRGEGLGELLYEAVFEESGRRGSERVLAEVNLTPPNPGSSRFHRRLGFEAVGTQRLGADYEVEMLARPT